LGQGINQVFLVRTQEQNWGKGLTLDDAVRKASLSLNGKFIITVFEKEGLTMDDISVSGVDGSAEYPKDATCTTLRCNGIMKALGVSVEDLLQQIDDWTNSIPDVNKATILTKHLQQFRNRIEEHCDEEDVCNPIET
jgi:hypothetical protein